MTTTNVRLDRAGSRTPPPALPQATVLQEGKIYSLRQLRQAALVAAEPGTHFKLAIPKGTWSIMSMSSQLTYNSRRLPNGRQVLDVTVGEQPMRTLAGEHYWLQLIRTDKVDRRDLSFGVFYDNPDTGARQLILGRGSSGRLEVAGARPPRPIINTPS